MRDYDVSGQTPPAPPRSVAPLALKLVVAGGFGAGKTTFIGSVSEIEPLATEEYLTSASEATDPLHGVEGKAKTTVSMDFGRITLDEPAVRLHLFGTPGQDRFLWTWEDLAYGAIGAVVLADTRRLPDCFTAIGYFLERQLPFVVAVNEFEGRPHHYDVDEVREALDLPEQIPVLLCDARRQTSAVHVLFALVERALKCDPPRRPSAALGA